MTHPGKHGVEGLGKHGVDEDGRFFERRGSFADARDVFGLGLGLGYKGAPGTLRVTI